jgi:hypothetical protein
MRRYFRWLLFAGLIVASLAAAQGKVNDFKGAPKQLSESEIAALKEVARKGNLPNFRETGQEKPQPIPWMAIGLGVIAFIVAIPFAMRSYRDTAREVATATAFASSARRPTPKKNDSEALGE